MGTSFALAEKSDILGLVIVCNEPYQQVSAIEDGVVPHLEKCDKRHRKFHVSCADAVTSAWLCSAVDSLVYSENDY